MRQECGNCLQVGLGFLRAGEAARLMIVSVHTTTIGHTAPVPTCYVCGEPARDGGQDLRQLPPVVGKDGQLWADWARASMWFWWCEKHPRRVRKWKPGMIQRYYRAKYEAW
jgi:hypothetical protein